jgi:hypothetical protein
VFGIVFLGDVGFHGCAGGESLTAGGTFGLNDVLEDFFGVEDIDSDLGAHFLDDVEQFLSLILFGGVLEERGVHDAVAESVEFVDDCVDLPCLPVCLGYLTA